MQEVILTMCRSGGSGGLSTSVTLPIQRVRDRATTSHVVKTPAAPYATTVHLPIQRDRIRFQAPLSRAGKGRVRILTTGTQVIYGTTAGPFKLNPCIEAVRRRGSSRRVQQTRVHVIHLGLAKADVATVVANLQLLTFTHDLAIGEFLFVTPNRLLKITNLEVIDEVLVQDGNTNAIPIQYLNTTLNPVTNIPIPTLPV